MGDELSIPHTWKEFVWLALVAIIANRANWIATLFTSKAEATKTTAEARDLDLEHDLKSGDAVIKLIARVVKATERAELNQVQRDHWRRKAEALQAEKNLLDQQLEKYISVEKRLAE